MRGRPEGEEDFPRQADPSVQGRGDIREHCAWKEMQIVQHKQVQRVQGTCLGRGAREKAGEVGRSQFLEHLARLCHGEGLYFTLWASRSH